MEDNLKVGQQFEVVEVLTGGYYSYGLFKTGGHTIMSEGNFVLTNGKNYRDIYRGQFGYSAHMYDTKVKKVGRLTLTKIK